MTTYCTLADVKSRLKITDNTDDAELNSAIESVCAWIDMPHCQDFFGQVTVTRTFETTDPFLLTVPSLVSITTLKTDPGGDGTFEIVWSASDYQLLPYNPNNGRETRPYNKIKAIGTKSFPYAFTHWGQRSDVVQIAGIWGWPAVPLSVREAALILTVDTFKLKDAPFNVAGFDTFGVVRVKENGPALNFLSGYRRFPVGV